MRESTDRQKLDLPNIPTYGPKDLLKIAEGIQKGGGSQGDVLDKHMKIANLVYALETFLENVEKGRPKMELLENEKEALKKVHTLLCGLTQEALAAEPLSQESREKFERIIFARMRLETANVLSL